MGKSFFLIALVSLSACTTSKTQTNGGRAPKSVVAEASDDPYLWLEEIESQRSLAWVKERNEESLSKLKSDPRFKKFEPIIRKITYAKDRFIEAAIMGGKIYNFWQDEQHKQGIWRRTSLESYAEKVPKWENLLDLDQLAKNENENWVWKTPYCLPPKFDRCLLYLSRGGKDASVIREFDLNTKAFVPNGFEVPEAISYVSWIDKNSIYLATDFGPGTLSKSGKPLVAKRWARGTALSAGKEIFRGQPEDERVYASLDMQPDQEVHYAVRNITSEKKDFFILDPSGGKTRMPIPTDSNIEAFYRGYLIFSLRSNLPGTSYVSGSVLALPISSFSKGERALQDAELVFAPSEKRFKAENGVSVTGQGLVIDILDNVRGKIMKVIPQKGRDWTLEEISFGESGMAATYSADSFSKKFLATFTDFITPYSVFSLSAEQKSTDEKLLRQGVSRFDASGLRAEQWEAISKDGTKIPYFIVYRDGAPFDGRAPTLLYGYGGFDISSVPGYLGYMGKVWAEEGGVYVLANIRGGGEFGPNWHKAAILENKQKSYDDFIAVAEDLIKRGITSPQHLGIEGGSNGGLLVGATFVQRPDLFNAVLCEGPLLDMFRYHKLLSGSYWMDEYGNPDDPKMREVISRYSPYQNVKEGVKYPEVFFQTNTKDDRVHPGHARKMVAKMRDQGHPVIYFENIDGGHMGEANLEQSILQETLNITYLWKKLGR